MIPSMAFLQNAGILDVWSFFILTLGGKMLRHVRENCPILYPLNVCIL